MIKKYLILASVFIAFTAPAHAETVSGENGAKELTDQIMSKIVSGDIEASLNLARPYWDFPPKQIDDMYDKTRASRKKHKGLYGETFGFEFIDSKIVGESLIRLRYIEKAANTPLLWTFHFYNTKEGWKLNMFEWKDQFQSVFD